MSLVNTVTTVAQTAGLVGGALLRRRSIGGCCMACPGSPEVVFQPRCRLRSAFVLTIILASVTVASASRADTATSGLVNTLRWATDSEVEVFGFYIYRARANDGNFVKLNDVPVSATGAADIGAEYRYDDRGIEAGVRYRYHVNQLTNSGREERLTPVLTSEPKYPDQ